jgi:uncharacterized protein
MNAMHCAQLRCLPTRIAQAQSMNIELNPLEARVIGCMIEKQITTPDQYPLSLNAITNACNQKSNRDPVLDLDERAVQTILDGLVRKHMVIERSGFGSRVPKYQQTFCNTEFGSLKFTPIETGIICELLLRGPQTPGELRTRANRMAEIGDVSQVESALQNLSTRPDGPFVVRLPRQPNRRDSQYAQLFCGAIDIPESSEPDVTPSTAMHTDDEERLARLEKLVDQLVQEVSGLKKRLGDE